MKKDSKNFKIELGGKETIDVTFRDSDGAITAHLTAEEAVALGSYLISRGGLMRQP